ncbi:MAG: hypothetical protein R2932_28825 [Caldilineaceae bacterium]
MKMKLSLTQGTLGIVLLASVLMWGRWYVQSEIQPSSSIDSTIKVSTTSLENTTEELHSPFKQKALVKTEQNGYTTETTTISRREVELTPEQEQQYYSDYPEYKGWNAAYAYDELYRDPDPWGYHTFWDMLLSNDSGDATRTVVSLNIGPLSKISEVADNNAILNAPIGYKLDHQMLRYN